MPNGAGCARMRSSCAFPNFSVFDRNFHPVRLSSGVMLVANLLFLCLVHVYTFSTVHRSHQSRQGDPQESLLSLFLMAENDLVLRIIASALCLSIVSYLAGLIPWRARSHGHRLPPGPTGLPFVGHILHMRRPALWEALDELCRTYGKLRCRAV